MELMRLCRESAVQARSRGLFAWLGAVADDSLGDIMWQAFRVGVLCYVAVVRAAEFP